MLKSVNILFCLDHTHKREIKTDEGYFNSNFDFDFDFNSDRSNEEFKKDSQFVKRKEKLCECDPNSESIFRDLSICPSVRPSL